MERSLAWLRENSDAIFESAPCGYIFTLLDGSIVKTNQTLSIWTGIAKEDLIAGKKFRDLLSGGGKIYFETNCAPLLRMQGFLNEVALDISNLDGSRIPVLLNSEQLKNDQGIPVLFRHTLFNIADRQKYERELLSERRKLEGALNELQEEKLVREKFVATLTHDLRSPITAAKMGAQLILRKTDDPELIRSLTTRLLKSVDRLDIMIQDLLDANSIRAGEKISMRMDSVDIALVINEALSDLITVHGERFNYQGPKTFIGYWNSNGIRRIVENLCNNAVKYGSLHEPIVIKLVPDHEWVTILVHNYGNPIPQREIHNLFDLYKRSESAITGTQKGWGLGLTLVKGVTSAHLGNVHVTSSADLGTTFSVTLPLDSRTDH